MATVEEGLRSQVRNIEANYGRSIDGWVELIRAGGRTRHGEIVTFLKAEHGLSHGAANRVALVAIDAMAEKSDSLDPEAALYEGAKAELLPIHAKLMALVRGLGSDIETAPKKGYVSLRRRKQFAMIKPAAKHVDLGLILPATPVTGRLESAATFNALFTHRVRIRCLEDIDDELATWLGSAYAAAA
jgi:predicted transport protein